MKIPLHITAIPTLPQLHTRQSSGAYLHCRRPSLTFVHSQCTSHQRNPQKTYLENRSKNRHFSCFAKVHMLRGSVRSGLLRLSRTDPTVATVLSRPIRAKKDVDQQWLDWLFDLCAYAVRSDVKVKTKSPRRSTRCAGFRRKIIFSMAV